MEAEQAACREAVVSQIYYGGRAGCREAVVWQIYMEAEQAGERR